MSDRDRDDLFPPTPVPDRGDELRKYDVGVNPETDRGAPISDDDEDDD